MHAMRTPTSVLQRNAKDAARGVGNTRHQTVGYNDAVGFLCARAEMNT